MTTITLNIDQAATTSTGSLDRNSVAHGDTFIDVGDGVSVSREIPPLTNAEQAYFWSSDWQAAERAAESELHRGEAPTFHTVEDGMRWLLSKD